MFHRLKLAMMIGVTTVSIISLVTGCQETGQPYTDNSRDPELYATRVKQVIITEANDARKSKEPEDHVSIIVTTLNRGGPIGNYGNIYKQLKQIAEPLLEACETDGIPNDLVARLDQLLEVVDQLPGGDLKPLD